MLDYVRAVSCTVQAYIISSMLEGFQNGAVGVSCARLRVGSTEGSDRSLLFISTTKFIIVNGNESEAVVSTPASQKCASKRVVGLCFDPDISDAHCEGQKE